MKITIVLTLPDVALVAAALGYMEGGMEQKTQQGVQEALKNTELDVFFENKNELTAALRSLVKRCAAEVEAQA